MRHRRHWRTTIILSALTLILAGGAVSPAAADSLVEVPYEHFFIVEGEQGRIRVLQVVTVFNAGSVPEEGVILSLPEGARLVEPEEGWGPMEPADGSLRDSRVLAPGESREYRVLYEVMMGSRPIPLRRPLPYPMGEVTFWVEDERLRMTGLQLEEMGPETVGGETFRRYRMLSLPAHESWQVVVRPERPPGTGRRDLARHGDPLAVWQEGLSRMGWFLPAALAGLGGILLWRRRSRTGREGEETGLGDSHENRWREEIVRLDVAYRTGEVDEDVYWLRREALLRRLLGEEGIAGRQEGDRL